MVNQLLQNIIQHAYNTVPYYHDMFDKYNIDPLSIKIPDDLIKLPVLKKELIQAEPDRFISSDYLYYPNKENLVIKRTSGSTGKFLKVYWSRKDETRSMFHLWIARMKQYGIDPKDRFCSFHTTVYNYNRLLELNELVTSQGKNNISLNKLKMNKSSIVDYYKQIIEYKPKWLLLQPSIAYLLSMYIHDNNLPLPNTLKYVELTGEYLFKSYEEKIKEVFQVRMANMYGCNEANGIAIECIKGHLHCLNNNIIVEVMWEGEKVSNDKEGEIYITCLTNNAMPFIRYALGDIGLLLFDHTCECGNKSPIIKLSAGRISDFISMQNGEMINSYVLLYPIEKINSLMNNPINQFKVVQKSINNFTLYLSLNKSFSGWKESIAKEFLYYVSMVGFGDIKWDFIFFDSILPDPDTGKFQFFINNLQSKETKIYEK